jgi:hypothetical protein
MTFIARVEVRLDRAAQLQDFSLPSPPLEATPTK